MSFVSLTQLWWTHIESQMEKLLELVETQNELLRELIRTVIENAPERDEDGVSAGSTSC